jgi:hypothetical protein
MKTKGIMLAGWLVLLGMLFGWASEARAYYPPCRDVIIWTEATSDGVSKRFCHSVTDPVLNVAVVGKSVEVFNNIDDFRVVDGVVIGVGNYNSNPSRKYVYLSVYDPVLHGWREEGVTDIGDTNYSGSSFPFWAYISCANGVVAIANADQSWFAPNAHMWAKTYDPKRGNWQGYYRQDGINTDATPYTEDGVAMFSLANLTGFGNMYALVWVLYDPRDGIWHYMSAEINGTPYPEITNATVYYTDKSAVSRHSGYVSSAWQSGQVTVPIPFFQIAPDTGPPPLKAWITDMSLGGTFWTTDFGEGAGPQDFRSGLHTFNNQGAYNVTQKVTNPNWPLSNITLTQTAHVLDINAPVGSMYIEPTPYGGAYTMVNEAMYINTTDIYVHYFVTGMDAGSTMHFTTDYTNWPAWTLYNPNVTVNEMYLPEGDGLKTVWAQFKDSTGNIGECSSTVYLDTTAPVDGTLTATGGPQKVTLRWGGFSDAGSGIAFYRIYYSTTGFPAANGTGGKLAGQTTSLSFVHRGLKGGTTYYYRVVAKDRLNHVSTGATAQAKAKGVIAPILELLSVD